MFNLSKILGQFVVKYQKEALELGRDSRLIFPGLTHNISHEIHGYLQEHGITSYLVVGNEDIPEKSKNWISADGLTSVRIGSFVAIACTGQMSKIQDSIRGSGGTIRSVAFSEDWPWNDNGSESFSFKNKILEELIATWTVNEDEQEWLKEFILDGLIKNTINSTNRREILLEKILAVWKSVCRN